MVDDYSKMCSVYLLKEKSQFFDIFKKIDLLTTNEAQLNVGTIRIDNGGEYTSNFCEIYLQENGIKHETTIPYNPQKNGVTEWMRKSLLNMVRSTMFFKNVKVMFFGETILYATYIRNFACFLYYQ